MSFTLECKEIDCHKIFELNDDEIAFFKSKDLPLPKRCRDCRKKRRAEKLKREEGL